MSNSSTAIAYVNIKGGTKSEKCSEIAIEIWLWCFKIVVSYMRHIFQENPILKQTSFLENLTVIQNSNLILRYLLKLLISLATQKLIFLLAE